jgi:hypothetical protein
MAQVARERPAGAPLELLEPRPELRCLGLRYDADREHAALLPILFDLGSVRHFVIDFRNSSGQENRMRIGGRHALRDVVNSTLTEQLCAPFLQDVVLAP